MRWVWGGYDGGKETEGGGARVYVPGSTIKLHSQRGRHALSRGVSELAWSNVAHLIHPTLTGTS